MSIQVLGASGPAASGPAGAEDGEDIVREVVEIVSRCTGDVLPDAAAVGVINVAGGAAAIHLRHAILSVKSVGVGGVVDHVACGVVLIGRTEETIVAVYGLTESIGAGTRALVGLIAPSVDSPLDRIRTGWR